MTKKYYVDPPSGWMYGFPKVVDEKTTLDDDWFRANGYPQKLIEQGMLKYVRYFPYKEPADDTQ